MNKQALREAKEIQRLEREQARPKSPVYLYYMLLIVSVVYIADEVASQIGKQMQSVIAQALFAPVFGTEVAVARMSAIGMLTLVGFLVAMLYKPLADRYGRKRFLVINTLGMGLGLLVISAATNIPVYILGSLIIALFIPHDMQAVYILETTPPRHRAKIYAIIKAVATLGVVIVPALRNYFMGDDITQWRMVYVVPAIVSAGVAVFALFMLRETDAFVAKRLEYLRTDPAVREAVKKEKTAAQSQGGLLAAMKFCFQNKQLRWLLISGAFLYWGLLIPMYYEVTMVNGYAAQFLAQGMVLEQAKAAATPFVTQALFWFPIGSASVQLVQGFLADKWGRKPAVILMSVCTMSAFALFFLGSQQNWTPWIVGLLCGAAVGGYWAAGDVAGGLMCAESTPTNLRSSVLAVQPAISGIASLLATGVGLVLINILGDSSAGLISLALAVPGTVIGLTIFVLKAHETKHVDLQEVTGGEA